MSNIDVWLTSEISDGDESEHVARIASEGGDAVEALADFIVDRYADPFAAKAVRDMRLTKITFTDFNSLPLFTLRAELAA